MKALEKVFKFYKDFTVRDSRIAELLTKIIPKLEHEINGFMAYLVASNIFVNVINVDQQQDSVTLQEQYTY